MNARESRLSRPRDRPYYLHSTVAAEHGGNSIDFLLVRVLARELAPVLAQVSNRKGQTAIPVDSKYWPENFPQFWLQFWPEILEVY